MRRWTPWLTAFGLVGGLAGGAHAAALPRSPAVVYWNFVTGSRPALVLEVATPGGLVPRAVAYPRRWVPAHLSAAWTATNALAPLRVLAAHDPARLRVAWPARLPPTAALNVVLTLRGIDPHALWGGPRLRPVHWQALTMSTVMWLDKAGLQAAMTQAMAGSATASGHAVPLRDGMAVLGGVVLGGAGLALGLFRIRHGRWAR